MTVGAAARADPPAPVVRRLVIDARDVRIRYGSHEALRGVDLSVVEGEIVAILGPNGAGKSTLLKALLGVVPLTQGSARIFGRPVRRGEGFVAVLQKLYEEVPVERYVFHNQNAFHWLALSPACSYSLRYTTGMVTVNVEPAPSVRRWLNAARGTVTRWPIYPPLCHGERFVVEAN